MSKNICSSCVHFGRCKWLIGAQAGDECDWLPSRYVAAAECERAAECPECGSDATHKTNDDPVTGSEEWNCSMCGHYFTDPLSYVIGVPVWNAQGERRPM